MSVSDKRKERLDFIARQFPSIKKLTTDANEILQVGNKAFEHDANGNMTKEILGSVTADYSYNPSNRVAEIYGPFAGFLGLDTASKTAMVRYEYDAFGRRSTRAGYTERERRGVVKLELDTKMSHLYDGLGFNVLAELEEREDNNRHRYGPMYDPISEYLYANGDILRRSIFGDTKYRVKSWDKKVEETAYYHQDPLGSTIMVTDEKGHVEGCFSYDVFGNLYERRSHPWGWSEASFLLAHASKGDIYDNPGIQVLCTGKRRS